MEQKENWWRLFYSLEAKAKRITGTMLRKERNDETTGEPCVWYSVSTEISPGQEG